MPVIVGFHKNAVYQTWQGDCYYFRLWVSNEADHLAERVQVYVKGIGLVMGDGRCETVPEFIPMNLRWADSEPGKSVTFESLNPHMGKILRSRNCLSSVKPNRDPSNGH